MENKFELGKTVATPGVLSAVVKSDIDAALARHQSGDWGELSEEGKATNEVGLRDGERLLSSYASAAGIRFWIITEWDRSVTTVLLPSEY